MTHRSRQRTRAGVFAVLAAGSAAFASEPPPASAAAPAWAAALPPSPALPALHRLNLPLQFEPNPGGSRLLYSTFLEGSADQGVLAQALDASGRVYLLGSTDSADFPVTPGAFQTPFTQSDANGYGPFVAVMDSTALSAAPTALALGDEPVNQVSAGQGVSLTTARARP